MCNFIFWTAFASYMEENKIYTRKNLEQFEGLISRFYKGKTPLKTVSNLLTKLKKHENGFVQDDHGNTFQIQVVPRENAVEVFQKVKVKDFVERRNTCSSNEKWLLYTRQNGVCALCKRNINTPDTNPISYDFPLLLPFNDDHIVPLSYFSLSIDFRRKVLKPNSVENRQLICCNCHKQKTDFERTQRALFKKKTRCKLEVYNTKFFH